MVIEFFKGNNVQDNNVKHFEVADWISMAWLMKRKRELLWKEPHFREEEEEERMEGSQLIAMWALVSFFGEEVELGCCCFAAELSTCKKPAREAHPQC